jgi:hypothetical protein
MSNKPPFVIDKVRAALPTYQWANRSLMFNFANSLKLSEFIVRRACDELVALGEAEKVHEGQTLQNYPRIIYRLKPQPVEKND